MIYSLHNPKLTLISYCHVLILLMFDVIISCLSISASLFWMQAAFWFSLIFTIKYHPIFSTNSYEFFLWIFICKPLFLCLKNEYFITFLSMQNKKIALGVYLSLWGQLVIYFAAVWLTSLEKAILHDLEWSILYQGVYDVCVLSVNQGPVFLG